MARNQVADHQAEEISIEFLITKKFHTSEEFSQYIENLSKERKITIMESLVEYCAEDDVDPGSISKLITSSLKQKLQAEAEKLNLLNPSKDK